MAIAGLAALVLVALPLAATAAGGWRRARAFVAARGLPGSWGEAMLHESKRRFCLVLLCLAFAVPCFQGAAMAARAEAVDRLAAQLEAQGYAAGGDLEFALARGPWFRLSVSFTGDWARLGARRSFGNANQTVFSSSAVTGRLADLDRAMENLRSRDGYPPRLRTGELLTAAGLGQRNGIGPLAKSIIAEAGLLHMIALSGFHLSGLRLLLLPLTGAAGLLQKRLLARGSAARLAAARAIDYFVFLAELALVLAFLLIVPIGASLVRSAVMAGLAAVAALIRRKLSLMEATSLSALAMLLWNPDYLPDLGFQLSFAGLIGVSIIGTRIQGLMSRFMPSKLAGIVSGSLGAVWATLPIIALRPEIPFVSLNGILSSIVFGPVLGIQFLLAIAWMLGGFEFLLPLLYVAELASNGILLGFRIIPTIDTAASPAAQILLLAVWAVLGLLLVYPSVWYRARTYVRTRLQFAIRPPRLPRRTRLLNEEKVRPELHDRPRIPAESG